MVLSVCSGPFFTRWKQIFFVFQNHPFTTLFNLATKTLNKFLPKKVVVIGAGFAGLASACYLAKEGYKVKVLEKNDQIGGRARSLEIDGFTFDMGPSWYWMPDVFDRFFTYFDYSVADFYHLIRLDPAFRIYFGPQDYLDIPADKGKLIDLFESLEKGAGSQLRLFLKEAAYKYTVGMQDLVYKPGLKLNEFLDFRLLSALFKLHLFQPFDHYVGRFFKDPRLIRILEFPILFLGASPQQTPALYSLMNYAGLEQGTFYPMGGMHRVIDSIGKLAKELGVDIHLSTVSTQLSPENGRLKEVISSQGKYDADYVVATADYHHVDQHLLGIEHQNYSSKYWHSRRLAPSALIFYLGIGRKLSKIEHHNLFFDESFEQHSKDIYEDPTWPAKPLFYVCCPSKTDDTVAPSGFENLFFLMPLAAGLKDSEELRESYFKTIIDRFENITGEKIRDAIIVRKMYCVNDFEKDYNAYQGNAYGLANTLRQTAFLKPKIKHKSIKNLFFAGHLTVPGPGVPPALISAKIVADQILQQK